MVNDNDLALKVEPSVLNVSDIPIDQIAYIKESSFKGEYPYQTIIESIEEQFIDYLNNEDMENYVNIFYTQLSLSYHYIYSNQSLEYVDERIEALDEIHENFINFMNEIIERRLSVGIVGFEERHIDGVTIQFIITQIYEYFILNARNNFKIALGKSIYDRLKQGPDLGEKLISTIEMMIEGFNPLIITITPDEFLKFTNAIEIIKLYSSEMIIGNFLMKYTPKIYQNELFAVELTNYIVGKYDLDADFNTYKNSLEGDVPDGTTSSDE